MAAFEFELPDLSILCVDLSIGEEMCINFPGGAKLCATAGYDLGDPLALVTNLLAQVNTALVPLQPFFIILECFKAVMDCITAIPDSLGPPPDPSKLTACISNLVEVINKLLQLLPQLSVPILVKNILQAIVQFLIGLKAKLSALLKQVARILAASLKAAELESPGLQIVVDCANAEMDAQLANLNMGLAPLNRLVAIINILLELAQLPCIPTLAGVTEVSEDMLAPLDATIELLQTLIAAIPAVDIPLLPIPGPDEPC